MKKKSPKYMIMIQNIAPGRGSSSPSNRITHHKIGGVNSSSKLMIKMTQMLANKPIMMTKLKRPATMCLRKV